MGNAPRQFLQASFMLIACSGAFAKSPDIQSPDTWRQLETKYLFGFTEGSDIGGEGEKEVSAAITGAFGKRAGAYGVLEHRLAFETTLSQFVQVEMGLIGASYGIRDVPGMDNNNRTGFRGAFGEIRYLLIEKTPNSPFGLTLSVEPNWSRLEDSTGARVTQLELETKLQADYELIPNRVYSAFNLTYEPEMTRDMGKSGWEREATLGVSAALAGRVSSSVVLGAELGYFRKYAQGVLPNTYEGQALYLGPTLYVQLTRKAFLAATFATQVAGGGVDLPGANLNLENFSRNRAKLKVGFEF